MKKRTKIALFAGIFTLFFVPLVVWAHGGDLTVRGVALGGTMLFAPFGALIVAAIVSSFPGDLE